MVDRMSSMSMQHELQRYRATLPWQLDFDALSGELDSLDLKNLVGLDVGLPSPVMSSALRKLGGTWTTLCLSQPVADRFSSALDRPVSPVSADEPLPGPDKTFSLALLGFGVLNAAADPQAFLRECHRVLVPDGHLLMCIEHAKPFPAAGGWRRKRAIPHPAGAPARYTERDLYERLKIGFDVLSVHSYMRFFVQSLHHRHETRTARHRPSGAPGAPSRLAYLLAHQLDGLLFFTRGYRLMVHARRRVWRERHAPMFKEGPPVSAAVLRRIS